MKVGFVNDKYPEQRCIIHKIDDAEYVKSITREEKPSNLKKFILRVKNGIAYRLHIKGEGWNLSSTQKQAEFPQEVDVIHLFNSIYAGKENWCTTFESQTPVTDDLIGRAWERNATANGQYTISRFSKRALKCCAQDSCLGLIALSDSAYHIQMEMLDKVHISAKLRDKIKGKVKILHPPQEVLISAEELEKKFTDLNQIRFIFVGHDFFRKGGDVLVDVLQELQKEYNIHLTVVSKLFYGDYAGAATKEMQEKYLEILRTEDWIDYYESLPNEIVMEKLKASHVGCLPTLADTYGYFVLECQAMGCPCITTDIRALQEINHNEIGWIVPVKQNNFREAVYGCYSDETKRKIAASLYDGMRQMCLQIVQHPEQLFEKGQKAIRRIEAQHSKEAYAKRLETIYTSRVNH